MSERFDPITLEIIQSSLQSISEEMFGAMRKTAMSPIIYEVLDMATAITDAEGNLASSGAGIPGFVGDGGQATDAQLGQPSALAVDAAGSLYIGDWVNGNVRMVDPHGVITTVVTS